MATVQARERSSRSALNVAKALSRPFVQLSEAPHIRNLTRFALSIGTAALLAGCSGSQPPIGASGAMPQSRAVTAHDGRTAVSPYLYVTDVEGSHGAVFAFDATGNKVAEIKLRLPAWDVVTDSGGHVYLDYPLKSGGEIVEYTHDLRRLITALALPAFSRTMTIDVHDNLYAEYAAGGWVYAIEYPRGSTKSSKTYRVAEFGGGAEGLLGVSARGNTLYIAFYDEFSAHLWKCPLDSDKCVQDNKENPANASCGFTTTHRLSVYGICSVNSIDFNRLGKDWSKTHRGVYLPAGYLLPWNYLFLHSFGNLVWGCMLGTSSNVPAEAFEFDALGHKIAATVGAGYLQQPVAAYYGNGFRP